MNDTTGIRRLAATLTIGSFSIAALMGIVALLGGGDFGEGEARVLLTTLVIGCASVCMLCYLAPGGTRFAVVGITGAIALILPVTTALLLVWSEWDTDMEGLLKAFGVGVVVAVTLAQLSLLLSDVVDRAGLKVVLTGTVVLAVVLAGLIISLILEITDGDDLWRVLGVVAILDVLGTLVTIALAKFGGRGDGRAASAGPAGVLAITLTGELAAALQARARVERRAPADLVDEAVQQYLDSEPSAQAASGSGG